PRHGGGEPGARVRGRPARLRDRRADPGGPRGALDAPADQQPRQARGAGGLRPVDRRADPAADRTDGAQPCVPPHEGGEDGPPARRGARGPRVKVVRGEADGTGLRVGIVVARFNEIVTTALLDGAVRALAQAGVADVDVTVVWVPGAFEIATVARRLALAGVDAVVCLGAVIRGETAHFDLVANEAARGIGDVNRETGVPCIFEVLATEDLAQAQARAGGAHGNKGWEAAMAALEMAHVLRSLPEPVAR